LVTIQHANSEVGTLQNINELGNLVQKTGGLFHTDAVQSVGKVAINVNILRADLLSISSHKIYGPKGVGALFIKRGTPSLFSHVSGGGQEKKRRGGTENVPGIVGFGKACQIAQYRLNKGDTEQLKKMRDQLRNQINRLIPNVKFFGCPEKCLPNTLNCGFEGADGEALLIALDMEGIFVSTGSACSSGAGVPSQVLRAMRLPQSMISSSLRFSLGFSNTFEDINFTAATLANAVMLSRQKFS
jgi:cysteine desulfurase